MKKKIIPGAETGVVGVATGVKGLHGKRVWPIIGEYISEPPCTAHMGYLNS